MNKLKLLDLFSGIGGFSYGLEQTQGFDQEPVPPHKSNMIFFKVICLSVCLFILPMINVLDLALTFWGMVVCKKH